MVRLKVDEVERGARVAERQNEPITPAYGGPPLSLTVASRPEVANLLSRWRNSSRDQGRYRAPAKTSLGEQAELPEERRWIGDDRGREDAACHNEGLVDRLGAEKDPGEYCQKKGEENAATRIVATLRTAV